MKWLLRSVGLWTIADAIFLIVAPKRWSRWWDRWLLAIGESGWAARLVGLLELASGVYLIQSSLVSETDRRPYLPATGSDHRAAVDAVITAR